MPTRTIEIRAGEGGTDARLFVADLALSYIRMADRKAWKVKAIPEPDRHTGHQVLVLSVEGIGVERMDAEAGGHRTQRIPPTERSGRVHSSTVTVAVLDGVSHISVPEKSFSEFHIEWFSGTGCGGQHRNKHMNSARVTHIPTGLVRTASTRSRENSLRLAMDALLVELDRQDKAASGRQQNGIRRIQVGSGQRSDKRRTYQFQNDIAKDHVTNKQASLSRVMRGNFDLLW